MTPYEVSQDPARSIAYMRDVVGYGLLPGEISSLDDLAAMDRSERASVIAWYWPDQSYGMDLDPFEQFAVATQSFGGTAEAQRRLRMLAASRLSFILFMSATASERTVDELFTATCWIATCSGQRLAGALEGTHGLSFTEFGAIRRLVGAQYIDPRDNQVVLSSWTSNVAEEYREATGQFQLAVFIIISTALLKALEDAKAAGRSDDELEDILAREDNFLEAVRAGKSTDEGTVDKDEIIAVVNRWSSLASRFNGETPEEIAQLQNALRGRERVREPHGMASVIADLVAPSDPDQHTRAVQVLGKVIAEQMEASRQQLVWMFKDTRKSLKRLAKFEFPNDGYGWLLMDRPALAGRIDAALADFASTIEYQTALQKRYASGTDANSFRFLRGDTYPAPALGSRYRGLYEELVAIRDHDTTLEVDAQRMRIRTPGGWIALPASAVTGKAWWSGSAQSAPGRPQVLAWLGAGFRPPDCTIDGNGKVSAVTFEALPGRELWLSLHPRVEDRLALGGFTVPEFDDAPYHTQLHPAGVPKTSVWQMAEGLVSYLIFDDAFRLSSGRHDSEGSSEGGEGGDSTAEPVRTDADWIDMIVEYLRERGEASRREIEDFIAPKDSTLSEDVTFARWVPNLLAKARRHGRIKNIGSRKQPRWIATGAQSPSLPR